MTFIEKIWQNKVFRTFIWNVISVFIGLTLISLLNWWIHFTQWTEDILNLIIIPWAIAVIKFINKEYLWDAWVVVDPLIKEIEKQIKQAKENK